MQAGNSSPSVPVSRRAGVPRLFLAFEVSQYRWLWGNIVFSSMGQSTTMLVQGWLVLTLTDSPFWVGLAAGLRGLGVVVFGTFGGVLLDRLDRRKVLVFVQLSIGTVVLTVGLLVLAEQIALWHILISAFLLGVLHAVHGPARNALIYQAVGPHRLLNAMAGRTLAMNVTRIVGAVTAGVFISALGIASCYLFIAGSMYIAPVLLLFMRGAYQSPSKPEPFWHAASEGISYAWANGQVRMLLLVSVLMETFGFSHHVMLPVMARDVLEVGASGLGFLAAASGAGAMVGTLAVAGLGDFRNKGGLLVSSAATAGLFLVLFALSPWYFVSLGLVTVVGASLMAYDVTMGTLLQLLSPDAMRGRVLGLYGLTYGFTPVGGFLAGIIATAISAPFAIGAGGVIIVAYVLRMLGPVGRIRGTEKGTAKMGD
ncbi:MFS transporter [Chloroflexota bacterium]